MVPRPLGGLGLLVLVLVGYGASLGFHVDNLHNGLLGLTVAAMGFYVLRVRPPHRVGQLFVGLGVAAAVMYVGRQYGLHTPVLPGATWLAWMSIWLVPPAMAAAGLSVMVFPTVSTSPGDGVPRRTRWSRPRPCSRWRPPCGRSRTTGAGAS